VKAKSSLRIIIDEKLGRYQNFTYTRDVLLMKEQAKKSRRLFRRPTGRTIFIAIALLIPIAIILSYVDIPGSIAFVEHFFTAPKHFTYRGHSDYVSSVAWSPDVKRIASASGDKTVQVWNAATGAQVLTYHGHVDAVFAVAWSPDQTRIASASNDGTVQVWNATTGKTLVTFGSQHVTIGSPLPWNTVAWSPDGKRIATGGDGDVRIWDAATGGNVTNYGYHGGVVH
jgi:WD40 repeat protein